METRANHLMVGAFVLALAFGLLAFVVWLAKFQFDTVFAHYHIRFNSAVTGLKEGSVVRYQGVKVGEVVAIVLDPNMIGEVLVTVELEKSTPVRDDTTATLELEGLTGGRYVLLTGGTPEAAPLAALPDEKLPLIASRASSLEQVLEGAPEVLASVNLLLARGNDLLNATNRQNIAQLIDNLTVFSAVLAEHGDEIGGLISDTSKTMANLNEATLALRDMSTVLRTDSARILQQADATLVSIESMASNIDVAVADTSEQVRDLIKNLQASADGLTGTTHELEALIAENREPIRDFTSTGLYELTNLLTEARDLILVVNRVTTEVERDPARFIFGNQQQGYEAQ